MKQLLIIRHAKSSWDFSVMNDFDRPLNERGHADAPKMAKRLLDKKIDIDAFISSAAKRALTTATYFAETYDVKKKDIIKVDELYHAPVKMFYTVITTINNKYNTVAIFSHNPGITDFVNELTDTSIDNMPTCGIYAIAINTNDWKNFRTAGKDFLFFDYPKNVQ
jgi:phosphohistidine phosphatase